MCVALYRKHIQIIMCLYWVGDNEKNALFSAANFILWNGTNPKTMLPLVKKFLKRHVGIMSHYYMLNKTIKDFKVAKPDLSEKCFNSLNEAKSNILKYEKVEKFSELVDDLSAIKRRKKFAIQKF